MKTSVLLPTRNRLDYLSAFFFNTADGSFIRVHPVGRYRTAVEFSRDGRTAAWMEAAAGNRLELFVRRLQQSAPVVDTSRSEHETTRRTRS